MTGLGSFVGASGADPALVAGLLTSSQAIMAYMANPADPYALGNVTDPFRLDLTNGADKHLDTYAAWVRASLYLTDYTRDLDWEADYTLNHEKIALRYCNRNAANYPAQTFYTINRPSMDVFKKQLEYMRDYADQRAERSAEIITQVALPMDYFGTILGLTAARNRYTFELMTITLVLAAHTAMIAKHHLACRRPDRLGATVMPMLETPGHPTFPSAHAAEAFAIATVLGGLVNSTQGTAHYPAPDRLSKLLDKQAERIAVNRTVAGLHYPVDSWAGAALGRAVGRIILAKCGVNAVAGKPWAYTADKDSDFMLDEFKNHASNHGLKEVAGASDILVKKSGLFEWLWTEVTKEFSLD